LSRIAQDLNRAHTGPVAIDHFPTPIPLERQTDQSHAGQDDVQERQLLANLQARHKQDDKKPEQHIPAIFVVEEQFPDLGIKNTAGPWELLFDPATQDSQAHRTNAGEEADFASLLPVSPSAKASTTVKKHTKDNQGNGKMNTYGMQQDDETGVKRGYWHAFISPTETDGQYTADAKEAAYLPPEFSVFHGAGHLRIDFPPPVSMLDYVETYADTTGGRSATV